MKLIPRIWFVQGRKYMHEAPDLSVTHCSALEAREARERRAKDGAHDRRNEDQHGR